jgi:hypothetical protein
MIKRAPDNVRYLGQFGEHILTRSFTARDPMLTSHGTVDRFVDVLAETRDADFTRSPSLRSDRRRRCTRLARARSELRTFGPRREGLGPFAAWEASQIRQDAVSETSHLTEDREFESLDSTSQFVSAVNSCAGSGDH